MRPGTLKMRGLKRDLFDISHGGKLLFWVWQVNKSVDEAVEIDSWRSCSFSVLLAVRFSNV